MKFTRVIEGNGRTHEFKIGDIVRVLFAVYRQTKAAENGDGIRTYLRSDCRGEFPQYAYYTGYRYLCLGKIITEDVGDETYVAQNIFYTESTIKVACFKTHERGVDQFAYFGDLEPIAGRTLTPEYLNWKKHDDEFKRRNPEHHSEISQILREEAYAMKCSCCGRFKKGTKCLNPKCEGW